jgi:hypothetical protein
MPATITRNAYPTTPLAEIIAKDEPFPEGALVKFAPVMTRSAAAGMDRVGIKRALMARGARAVVVAPRLIADPTTGETLDENVSEDTTVFKVGASPRELVQDRIRDTTAGDVQARALEMEADVLG